MKELDIIDKEDFELNERIMDLKTELYIAEAKKKELYQKRNKIIGELQAQLDKKDNCK